jgi:hypothetical protein
MKNAIVGMFIVAVVLILGGGYWFGVRPGQVRKECWERAKTHSSNISAGEAAMIEKGLKVTRADYEKMRDDEYKACLLVHGLSR